MKKILLDLGGVAFQSTGKSNDQIDWSIISKLNEKHGHQLNIGEDIYPVFIKEYNELSNQNFDGDQFLIAIWETLEFNSELVDFLKKHFEIFILSDNYRENIEFISKKFDFDSWSTKGYYSYDYKMGKENTALFKQVIADLKTKPEDLLFVDDSQYKIDNARLCGIPSILFTNNESLKESIAPYIS